MSEDKKRSSGCPIAFGLDTFGDRWSLLIIRDMMLSGKKTYGDFLDGEEAISTNILADRLKYLEAEGIVAKSRDPENRRSFIYSLTEKGRDLAPVVLEIIKWGGKYDHRPNARKTVPEQVRHDGKGLEAKLRRSN
ncbi:MAG: helix-turn-helix transcriptional regulator [Hyphomicrobiales bacterium]|nr:helix-turn-helix transcriptional regulator [Hyphomicrobiales bacterium]